MPQGVGIRYNSNGVRILKVEKAKDGLKVSGIAAGVPSESLNSFAKEHGFSLNDSAVAIGLGPGDFLTSSLKREEGMDDSEMQEHLRWEIERKIISEPSEYNFDFALMGDIGFVFAGRKKLIKEMIKSDLSFFTDVEPVALFNGCVSIGEIADETMMLASVEAEGISSVVVESGMPVAMESFSVREDEIANVLPGLDREGMAKIDVSIVERLTNHIVESINRLTSFGENKDNPTPKKLVLAGGGVYTGELTNMVGEKSGIETTTSDPFASIINDVEKINPELSGMNAAFTTCFGLALRAMEV